MTLPYTLDPDDSAAPPLGLIVLQTDETIEPEFRQLFAAHPSPLYVSRIPSGAEVSTESLGAMQAHLTAAADLLPKARRYAVVGYGCTSASSVIGSATVERLVLQTCDAARVTNPLRAAVAQAQHLGVSRFALLSPYVEEVSASLRAAFAAAGLSTDVFGSFGEAEEAKVARISTASIVAAASTLGADRHAEAVFLSCTNLRTLRAIPEIEAALGKPVLSSNSALAWDMQRVSRGA